MVCLQEEGRNQAHVGMTQAASEAAVVDLVTSYVGEIADRNAPLAQQGLDSLAAMELRQKLQVELRDTEYSVSSFNY